MLLIPKGALLHDRRKCAKLKIQRDHTAAMWVAGGCLKYQPRPRWKLDIPCWLLDIPLFHPLLSPLYVLRDTPQEANS
jgi:hypothetical protein